VAWGGVSRARMARAPAGPKDAGRVADIDGAALAEPPLQPAPAFDPALPWSMRGGSLNDASGLSRTPVYGVVEVASREDVAAALAFARASGLKVSVAAVRHSMGGHAFDDNALVLDMRHFNRIALDAERRTVRVEPGATWHDIQNVLHPRFAVKAMQSTDIFSVGGSISVNAHGMDHHAGAVAGSLRSLELMRADGSVVTCSRQENAELFRHVVGGYGLFGVIVSAELEVVDNAVYRTSREIIASDAFPAYFDGRIAGDDRLGLFYGHLSTAPGSLLREMVVYRYEKVADGAPADMPALGAPGLTGLRRLIYPNGVFSIRYGNIIVDDDMQRAVMLYLVAFLALWVAGSLVLAALGYDVVTSISAVATSLANVGPGIGPTIGPAGNFSTLSAPALHMLSLLMLLGRVEILTVLVLAMPTFWRN